MGDDRDMESFWNDLTLSFPIALSVVVTTSVMYLLLVLFLQQYGARLFANPSPRAWATVTLLGAIVGRSSLGIEPDLEGGVLALATVLAWMSMLEAVRRARGGRSRGTEAHVLVVDGVLQPDVLARHRLTEHELWIRLREGGRASLDGVALVVLEPTGRLSVIPTGAAVDPRALADLGDHPSST